MIYFRTREILYTNINSEDLKSSLNTKTSKVNYLFDSKHTSFYVLNQERIFLGKKINEDETIISRYRHTIFSLIPRIVVKWKAEQKEDETKLVLHTRLARGSSIIFMLIFISCTASIVLPLIQGKLPDPGVFFPLMILLGLVAAIYFEIRTTEKLIERVIMKKDVKGIFTV